MTVNTEFRFASIDNFFLDSNNSRFGRRRINVEAPQETLLDWMRDFALDELAYSFLENRAFWTHEALIVVEEPIGNGTGLVAVEGNRRLAALMYLKKAVDGSDVPKKWEKMIQNMDVPTDLFTRIPFLKADSRRDVQAFLAFRHSNGIKQWGPNEKAAFIAKLIEESDLCYEQVGRKIGSKAPTVRRHYIAHRLLLQIEGADQDFNLCWAENSFPILYMSIQLALFHFCR